MRAKTIRVDRWEKTPARTAQDKIKRRTPAGSSLAGGSLFCTNLTQPTGNLDSASSEVVIHTLEEINKKMGKTILLVTHDPIIASSCDRIIFLKDGKVKEDLKRTGDKEQFYNEIITNWC